MRRRRRTSRDGVTVVSCGPRRSLRRRRRRGAMRCADALNAPAPVPPRLLEVPIDEDDDGHREEGREEVQKEDAETKEDGRRRSPLVGRRNERGHGRRGEGGGRSGAVRGAGGRGGAVLACIVTVDCNCDTCCIYSSMKPQRTTGAQASIN